MTYEKNKMVINFVCVMLMSNVLLGIVVEGRNYPPINDSPRVNKVSMQFRDHVITTVEIGGDMYDCIDINKQPGLHHPALNDHKIMMRPSSFPKGQEKYNTKSTSNHVGCPEGSIPIAIIKQQQEESVTTTQSPKTYDNSLTQVGEFNGLRAELSINNPKVNNNQTSNSHVSVSNGPQDLLDVIEVGLEVNPSKYKDHGTRLYLALEANGVRQDCYLGCSGYVHVNNQMPIGYREYMISEYDGVQYARTIEIARDANGAINGDAWWIFLQDEPLGYIPNSILTSLDNQPASGVTLAGHVASQFPLDPSPEMGTGHFPEDGWQKAAFFLNISVYYQNVEDSRATFQNYIPYATDVDCYRMGPLDMNDNMGLHLYFGGPGDQKC